ncbi:hypothetical protein ES703_84410 [subsurface metagenome]
MRGYVGIGVLNMKNALNYGTLFRSALCFNVDFIFLVGKRFRKQCSDTVRAERHIPLFEYQSISDFFDHIPYDCQPVGVEITEEARDLVGFIHPERAVYILGPEDGSLPEEVTKRCVAVIKIPTSFCLNVAVAGSIVLYDRMVKMHCV